MVFQFILWLFRLLQRLEEWLLSASVLVIAAMTVTNVFCRTVLQTSLAFAEEISEFCIIIVCFVGLSYAAGKGRHIRMTAIYDQWPRAGRKALMVLITGSTSALMLLLTWYAIEYVSAIYQLGSIYPALRVPAWTVYCAAPLGLFLAGIQYLAAMIKNLTEKDVYLSFEQKDEYEEPVTQEI